MFLKHIRPSDSRYRSGFAAFILLASTLFSACAPPGVPKSSLSFADKSSDSIGCESVERFEDNFWDALYQFPLSNQRLPGTEEVRDAFDQSLRAGPMRHASDTDRRRVRDALTELYQLLAIDSVQTLSDDTGSHASVLETLTSLEMGDRTTPEKARLQDMIRAQFAEIHQMIQPRPSFAPDVARVFSCDETPAPGGGDGSGDTPLPAPTPEAPQTLFSHWKLTRHPAVYGGLKAFATSYQSCSAAQIPALVRETPHVEGISIVGTHPTGRGQMREITNLNSFLRTHPYLATHTMPDTSCFDIQSKPPIYDFGGKPYATTDPENTLDFFTNGGTGSKELGVDCSGYVYSALASAGLKLKRTGRLKAIGVTGVSASMLMNPQSNGLTCLSNAVFTADENIRPGDILASSGHVVLVESVGKDPLGIAHIKSQADCKSSNISVSRFDFTILQSSPSKGGIGLNRMDAGDYFSEGGSMKTAMIAHAVSACLAKFKGSVTTSSSSANLVRHSGTSDCQDTPVRLVRESCVSSCPVRPPDSLPLPY